MSADVYKQLDYLAQELGRLDEMMAESIDPRTFGRLESSVEALADKVGQLAKDMETISAEMRTLTQVMSEARGSWRTIAWMAGAAATVGGFVSWVVQHVSWKG